MTTTTAPTYLTEPINDVRQTETPRFGSATGYGPKQPTSYMVHIKNKWRRVYVMNYGNIGSTYVIVDGRDQFLNGTQEWTIQTLAGGTDLTEVDHCIHCSERIWIFNEDWAHCIGTQVYEEKCRYVAADTVASPVYIRRTS